MKIEKKVFLEKISTAKDIYLMGHSDLDLDALGCAVGLVALIEQLHKQASIIINDQRNELAVTKVLEELEGKLSIVHGQDVTLKQEDLLIIVDTNKKSMVQDVSLLGQTTNYMIIDHHQATEDTIACETCFIDEEASSTCEMLTSLLEELQITLSGEINTFILAGIVLDTNNFVVKTDELAYYNAYLLTKHGADPRKVQYLLKQDMNDYIARQKVITNVQVHGNVALTKGENELRYRREDLAKIADTLLQFKDIEASFVIGKTSFNTVGISARSMGNVDIAAIVESLGGGGDSHDGAAKVEGKTIAEVEEEILRLLPKE